MVNLSHLEKITDSVGALQFCRGVYPDPGSGYTVDDNARALIVATLEYRRTFAEGILKLMETYLNFLENTWTPAEVFHNWVGADGRPQEGPYTEDAVGHAVWALGIVAMSPAPSPLRARAQDLLARSLPLCTALRSLRGKAFCVAGLAQLRRPFLEPLATDIVLRYADDLVAQFRRNVDGSWHWFEGTLTYANGSLPYALFLAYETTRSLEYLKVARESLDFLNAVCVGDRGVSLIGNKGWYTRGGLRARFDQQPIDAMWLALANLAAWKILGAPKYFYVALLAREWFLGKNDLGLPLYDPRTGRCHDGLTEHGVNENCGTESTLSALLTMLATDEAAGQVLPILAAG